MLGAATQTPGLISALWWIAPLGALAALATAYLLFVWMKKQDGGTARMQEIAGYVREGAYAYLYSQYRVVGIVFLILVALFTFLAYAGIQNPFVPVAFLTGGFFSGLCGFLGMKTATLASNRTAWASSQSLNRGLQVAFRSGAVMGLVVVGFGLFDICMWYLLLDKVVYTPDNMTTGLSFMGLEFVKAGLDEVHKYNEITTTMLTFGMGASTQALFARVGGGIYTKAADVGADLVGKVEKDIPEDDPRNPATIADNVGDNVGDVAGMGADLYESYCGSVLATAALGATLHQGLNPILAPMLVAGAGIIFSILGVFFVRSSERTDMRHLVASLNLGLWVSSAGILAFLAAMVWVWEIITVGVFLAVIAGLVAGIIIGKLTEYYTSDDYAPTKGIASQAKMGPATTIIAGVAVGMLSTGWAVVTIVLGILVAFAAAGGFTDFAQGLYGIGFAAVGMLSTLGITLATDAYGPIADNAGGNAEMSHLGPEVRKRTDALDMLGNTTAAIGKGFAIGSAALTAMALVASFMEEVRIWLSRVIEPGNFVQVGSVKFVNSQDMAPGFVDVMKANMADFIAAYDISLLSPTVLGGVFIGAMTPFLFSALTMQSVGRAASRMVEEVRRQFREIAGIMEGTGKPDYARCVAISTKGAQREMLFPSLLAIAIPIMVGLLLGVPGIIGLLAGGMTTGFPLAVFLNNAGGAWDNAKKHIEKDEKTYAEDDTEHKHPLTGKGSDQHKAGVVGDTVGDPCKDTSGPSLNILIKLMSMVAVVFAGVIVTSGNWLQMLINYLTK